MSTSVVPTANFEDVNSFENSNSRISSTTSVPPMQSQEDDSSIMSIGKYMDRLLKVSADVEQEERNYTNL